MKGKRELVFTHQAMESLRECLIFLKEELKLPPNKIKSIRKQILNKTEILKTDAFVGQTEEHLKHLNQNHRRIIESHYKIIYLVEQERIIITDIFDSRQDPLKMKG